MRAGTIIRWTLGLVLALVGIGVAVLAAGYWNATRDPIVRRVTIPLANWPAETPPFTILLVSDTHVAGPDMPPERLSRVVTQLNALRPDLVVIAGDLVSEKSLATRVYTPQQVVAPLLGFRGRLGIVVVMGNHDHWFDPEHIRAALEAGGVPVLRNQAVMRGPLVIGGVDDEYTGHDDLPATFAAMDALSQSAPRILVSHGPDVVPQLPQPVDLVLAGHMHCGQIVLPFHGAIGYPSRYGARFACGDITDHGQRLLVGAGLGTSIVPLRYGAPPDVWLVTLGPRDAASAAH